MKYVYLFDLKTALAILITNLTLIQSTDSSNVLFVCVIV